MLLVLLLSSWSFSQLSRFLKVRMCLSRNSLCFWYISYFFSDQVRCSEGGALPAGGEAERAATHRGGVTDGCTQRWEGLISAWPLTSDDWSVYLKVCVFRMCIETSTEVILGPVLDECINVPSVLFMLRLLSASQTGDLLFSLESVVYKEPHNGNTHTHTHTLFPLTSVTGKKGLTVTQIIRQTFWVNPSVCLGYS